MRHHQGSHDGEAEAAAARLPGPGLIGAIEPLEGAFCLVGSQPWATVGHLEYDCRRCGSGFWRQGGPGCWLGARPAR
jgi:hypothetical protein